MVGLGLLDLPFIVVLKRNSDFTVRRSKQGNSTPWGGKDYQCLLRKHLFNYDDLGVVGIVLLAYPLVFALAFAFATEKLNFQRR